MHFIFPERVVSTAISKPDITVVVSVCECIAADDMFSSVE